MKINGQNYNVDELVDIVNIDSLQLKARKNGLYLSDNQIDILRKNEINYEECVDIKMLLYRIDEALEYEPNDELEELSISLAEFDYYHNTNK